jgi:hypothetical protein
MTLAYVIHTLSILWWLSQMMKVIICDLRKGTVLREGVQVGLPMLSEQA